MKKIKKIVASTLLLSALAIPMVAQAGTSTISVGNGSFTSYAGSDNLGMSIKSVTGMSSAKSNIAEVTSQAASSAVVRGEKFAHSYRNSLSANQSYTVTNTGKSTNGSTKSHSQKA